MQGAYRTVLWGSIPIGTALGGAIASFTDIPTAIVVGGVLGVVSGIAVWWVLAVYRQRIAAAFLEEHE